MAEYTVLVLDDNWYNRDIFRMALESADYNITEAENGEQGLAILNEKTFDLLILDLQMPQLDGIQVLKKLRQDERHKHMRVLVVTANPHMATEDVNMLADHIMMKPVDIVSFARFTTRLKSAFNKGEDKRP